VQSEDCLNLNIWTPGLDGKLRPVLFWIHGGGFRTGSGSFPTYKGGTLSARGDVVVVSINYRLGPFGFLNLAEITGGAIPASGNEGLLDQIAALEWVRDHIAAFGGNPENITIFGESAGGMSVGALLAMPRAKGLFHKAIPQSGAAHTSKPLNRATLAAEHFLNLLGVKPGDAESLRKIPHEKLLKVSDELVAKAQTSIRELGGMPFQPVVDGTELPMTPIEALKSGTGSGIPVLVGTTLEEWKLFGALDPNVMKTDEEKLTKRINRLIPDADPEAMVSVYRGARADRGEDTSPAEIFMAIQTDRIFRIPAIRLAETLNESGGRAFNYLFTWKSPFFKGRLGSCHALELGFLFGTFEAKFSGSGEKAERLARDIQDAWIAFAHQGDPSCSTLEKWPVYGNLRETMVMGETTVLENSPYETERKAWDHISESSIGSL